MRANIGIRRVQDLTGVELAILHFHRSKLARLEREMVAVGDDDPTNLPLLRRQYDIACSELELWAHAISLNQEEL